jgi:hypothetical protein
MATKDINPFLSVAIKRVGNEVCYFRGEKLVRKQPNDVHVPSKKVQAETPQPQPQLLPPLRSLGDIALPQEGLEMIAKGQAVSNFQVEVTLWQLASHLTPSPPPDERGGVPLLFPIAGLC